MTAANWLHTGRLRPVPGTSADLNWEKSAPYVSTDVERWYRSSIPFSTLVHYISVMRKPYDTPKYWVGRFLLGGLLFVSAALLRVRARLRISGLFLDSCLVGPALAVFDRVFRLEYSKDR